MMVLAASNSSRSTTAAKASGDLIHISGSVLDALLLQLEGATIPYVVTDVLLIDQNLVDRSPGPGASKIGRNASSIEVGRNFPLAVSLMDESSVDAAHKLDFFRRAEREDHTICLDALVLPPAEDTFDDAMLVDQGSAQAEAGGSALAVALLDQPALAREHLGR